LEDKAETDSAHATRLLTLTSLEKDNFVLGA